MGTEKDSERYLRQSGMLPQEMLRKYPVTVVGVGAIGRQVALQLGVMGVSPLTLIDPGTVEEVNLGAQGFLEGDLGQFKVDATRRLIRYLNEDPAVSVRNRRFERGGDTDAVVFVCVDSIAMRGHIFRGVKGTVTFFVDGRMSAEALRVLTVYDGPTLEHYPTTLFRAEEAYVGPCTARTTFYAATIAAGLMVCQYMKWLRGMKPPADMTLNLLADELVVQGEPELPTSPCRGGISR